MNDQLARALGIQFVEKRGRGGGRGFADVSVTKVPSRKAYGFSFSERSAKKLGGYVRLAKSKNRVYIAPGCKDKYGFKLTGNKTGRRKYVDILCTSIGLIDNFIGTHELKYDADLDVYYITPED